MLCRVGALSKPPELLWVQIEDENERNKPRMLEEGFGQ